MNKNGGSTLMVVFGILFLVLQFYTIGEIQKLSSANQSTQSDAVSPDNGTANTATAQSWNTGIKEFTIETSSGEVLKYYTPEGMYSLTDQYLDNLSQYNDGASVKSDSMIVVGDASSPYEAKTVIDANKLSDVSSMLGQLYGDDFDTDSVLDSEAYTYMKTGKLPDKLPLNYEIADAGTFEVDGVKYTAYEVNYDTEYEVEADETAEGSGNEDETDSEAASSETEPEKEVVHTQQLVCYSDTEDAIEIVLYQAEFNRDTAIELLKEFLGVES